MPPKSTGEVDAREWRVTDGQAAFVMNAFVFMIPHFTTAGEYTFDTKHCGASCSSAFSCAHSVRHIRERQVRSGKTIGKPYTKEAACGFIHQIRRNSRTPHIPTSACVRRFSSSFATSIATI
jgi:hypothetical protein